MKNKRIFVDIHAIQTMPPSNVNRDDTGSPKTAQYGGITRSRVSSQSWKKAIREYFGVNSTDSNVGIRSLEIVKYIADKISELDKDIQGDDAIKLADDTLKSAGITTKDNKVKALFFLGSSQGTKLAQAAIDGVKDKKALQNILNENPPIDIALFGRMVADDPTLNEDASCQVAHAISTHGVQTEFDFFTATDDLAPEDNAGAGMLGTIEFNSSTLYRYANIAVHEFYTQLNEDKENTIAALKLFIKSFVKSMPTGKVNTFANQTLPQALVITVRSDRPVNLVTAFEIPVKSSDGFVAGSVEKLKKEFENVEKFVEAPVATFSIGADGTGEEMDKLDNLLDRFAEQISQILED